MIRALIVDDQPIVRRGLRMLLSTVKDLEISAEAKDGEEAIQRAVQLQPDLIVMDSRMPGRDGISATEVIMKRFPRTLIIIISVEEGEEIRQRAVAAGAYAFAEKGGTQTTLLSEVHRAIEVIQSRTC